MKKKRSLYVFLGLLLCAWPLIAAYATAGGTVTPGDEINKLYTVDKTLAPLGDNPVGGQVDLASGQLSIREVDVSIPGNSDLPVEFARTFSPDGHFTVSPLTTDMGELHDWHIDVPKIYAVLADPTMGTGGGWPPDLCSNFGPPPPMDADRGTKGGYLPFDPSEYWHGYFVHIPGKGTHQLLRGGNDVLTPGTASRFPVVTNNYWAVECQAINGVDANGEPDSTPGERFVLHTPDGRTYYFDHLIQEPQPSLIRPDEPGHILFRWRYVMLASKVEDAFGNWVAYHYDDAGKLTAIDAKDGRTIAISYNGDGKVDSVTANGKTWSYTYAADSGGYLHLHTVTLPDGRHWQFNLSSLINDAMIVQHPLDCAGPWGVSATTSGTGTITGPYGTTVSFVLAPTKQPQGDVPYDCTAKMDGETPTIKIPKEYYTLALQQKTISGPNMASLRWHYTYSATPGWYMGKTGAVHKTTSVLDPDGGKTTYWFDIRFDWHQGNLDWTDYYLNATDSSYYRRVTNDYSLRDTSAGTSEQLFANDARAEAIIRQSGQHIAQDGATYSWVVPDTDTDFDEYDNPLVRDEYDSAGDELEKEYTYENLKAAWWLGQVASVTIGAPSDVAGKKPYEATYLPNGRIGTVKHFGRLVGTYGWASDGSLTLITDPQGYQTQLTNYYRGRPKNIQFADGGIDTLAINDNGTIASLRNTRGYTTSYSYDPLGRLKKITYPTNDSQSWDPTTFDLAACSYIPAGIDAGSLCRTVTTGSEVETTYYDGLLNPVLTKRGSTYVRRKFDSAGRTVFESYPSTNPQPSEGTTYTYDGLGRLIRVIRDTEDGPATETITYSTNTRTVTDANGYSTTYTYRNLDTPSDQMLLEIDAPENQTTIIARDGLGAMTSATREDRSNNVISMTRQYIYNATRDLCMVVDPETGLTVMHYDNRGLMDWQAKGLSSSDHDCATVSVPDGGKTYFTYDGKRRIKTIDYPGTTNDISKQYDHEDDVTSLANGPVTWTYTYNGRDLLESGSLAIDGLTFAIDTSYNSRAQADTLVYPGGTETAAFSPDIYGRPTQVGSVVSNVTYHPDNSIASYTYANGTTEQMAENTRDLPQEIAFPGINTWDYTYDLNGNLMSATWSGPSGAPSDTRNGFAYDGLNRLTQMHSNLWGTSAFTYNALDNLLTKQYGSRIQNYTYDADNRLTAITGGLSYALSYDAQGNIIQRNSDTFTFDKANRMTSSDKGGSYVYDGWGRRVKTVAPDNEVTYTIYSRAGQLLQEYKPAGNKRTDYLYLAGKLVAEVANQPDSPATASSLTIAAGDGVDGNYTLNWSAISGTDQYWLTELQPDGSWKDIYKGAGLSAGVSGKGGGAYSYRLAGCTSDGCGDSASLTVGVAPIKPILTVPAGVQKSSYTISWTAPASATSYDLDQYYNGTWAPVASGTASTSAILPQVGGTFQYRVRAYNRYGTRDYTSPSAIVTVSPPTPAPVTFNLNPTASGAYTVKWTKPAGTVDHYQLEQSVNGGGWGVIYGGATPSWSTSKGPAHYTYQVSACSTASSTSCSAYSTSATEWVLPAPDTAAAPTFDVTYNISTNGAYTIRWSKPGNAVNAVQYYLQELAPGGSWAQLYHGPNQSFYRTSRGNGSYAYRVKACNSDAAHNEKCATYYSASSSVYVAHPPGRPTASVTPASVSTGQSYTLTWNTPSGHIVEYQAEQSRSSSFSGASPINESTRHSTSFSEAYEPGAYYPMTVYNRVRACNGTSAHPTAACGSWSATVSEAVFCGAGGFATPAAGGTGAVSPNMQQCGGGFGATATPAAGANLAETPPGTSPSGGSRAGELREEGGQ